MLLQINCRGYGRNRTNVWTYPGVNAFGTSRDAELAMHPSVKPVALVHVSTRNTRPRIRRMAHKPDSIGGNQVRM